MDNKILLTISEGSSEDCLQALATFNLHNEMSKDFKQIDHKSKQLLWDALFSRMKEESKTNPELKKACLNSLRILSRDKVPLEKAMTDDRVKALLSISGLNVEEVDVDSRQKSVEGLKVIFNMVFQSPTLQIMFISNGILNHLIKRIEDFTTTTVDYPHEFQYFVCRILFLVTALCQDTAPAKVRNLHNGLSVLPSCLESKMGKLNDKPGATNKDFDIMTSDIICEVLKVLYNLIVDLVPKNKRYESSESELDKEDKLQLKRITRIARVLLLNTAASSSSSSGGNLIDDENIKKQDIRRHSVDLLAAVPASCFEEFVPRLPKPQQIPPFVFEDHDMSAVEATLVFLEEKLDAVKKATLPPDNVAAPLLALHNMAINNRFIRKYLKRRILPPLKRQDVENLPEEGKTIRNKLVALLTSPITHITDLVANLLFVLCKEKVGKLVKYTGYGNAAGLLANRGLMLGGKPPPGKYSDSDLDDGSDTEEYQEVEHMINHIEGRIQLERPDPMEGMTDEQKEHEAMKLISAIDKMDRFGGGIRPCRIGPDGRPEPIEHVLQLQEALENPIKGFRREDETDSSD